MNPLAPRHARFTAFILMALLFLGLVELGLLVPIYAGLLAYSLILALAARWTAHPGQQQRSRWLGVAAVAALVVLGLLLMATGLHLALRNGHGVQDLMHKMGDILASARAWLPQQIQTELPEQQALLQQASVWLKEHASELGSISFGAIAGVGYALVGILLGALIAVNGITGTMTHRPLSQLLLLQVDALRDAFWRVATAQVKISLINTACTGIYLLLVLPAMGVQLPLAKTLVAITFVCGLLPVVGNLLSNTAIVTIGLNYSLPVAAGALLFLVTIHKLEYFINARIVGHNINARIWELLIAMLLLERLLGIAGLVTAPVFYAWLKAEWLRWDELPPEANIDQA